MRVDAALMPRIPLRPGAFLLSLALCAPALGQGIATDGSLGPAAQVLTGPEYEIGQGLGRVVGANLFHSFQRFGLEAGELARFRVEDGRLENVFARVTGGQPSAIAGAIETAGGAPALFLINPAGVVFSQGARIDVPGGFHVSTADSVRFPDGEFAADPGTPGRLSSAPPEAFGFLGNRLASLRIEGVSLASGDAPFEAVAGEVSLVDGGGVFSRAGTLRVVAFGGQAGRVPLAGDVEGASGALELANGAHLLTLAGDGPAGGAITVSAGSLRIDGAGLLGGTGVASQSAGSAPAGRIEVRLAGRAELRDGGFVGSTALAGGAAAPVAFSAAELLIDGASADSAGISSDVGAGATGSGGALSVNIGGAVLIRDGGYLRAGTLSSGQAGTVTLQARDLRVEGGEAGRAGVFSNSSGDGAAGGVRVEVGRSMALLDGGRVQSSAFAAGDAGPVTVRAGELTLDGGTTRFATVASDASFDSSGAAGPVSVAVERALGISNGGFISSSTFSVGDAGAVSVSAGELAIDGGDFGIAGVFSDSNAEASGAAGAVTVQVAGSTRVTNGGFITSSTFSQADAGRVQVDSGRLEVDGGALGIAEIRSSGGDGSSGNAGSVSVAVRDEARLAGGGRIRSGSFGSGDGGTVSVRAGELVVEGRGVSLSGIYSETDTAASGTAGRVDIEVDRALVLRDGGVVVTNAFGGGQAGSIAVRATSLEIDGGSEELAAITSTARNGSGSIQLTVRELTSLRRGGVITTSTFGAGDAGRITLDSGEVVVEAGGGAPSEIASEARSGASGGGGSVSVAAARRIEVGFGGAVSTSTFSAGRSGSVRLSAPEVVIADGIVAAIAGSGSAGQTGNLELAASRTLLIDNGLVTIQNDATAAAPANLEATRIRLEAPEIIMRNGGVVVAAASGNANASRVELAAGRLLRMDTAVISTTAQDGNGGAIELRAGKVLSLRDAGITTSVRGARGDGGDIAVAADAMILAAGFVQANTRADDARGGRVVIDVAQVVAGGGRLLVGGDQPFSFADAFGDGSFNVIQAAAPTGISGEIRLTGSVLDVAGSLVELGLPPIDLGAYDRDPCSAGRRNTFAVSGRGALPPGPRDFQRMVPAAGVPAAAVRSPSEGAQRIPCGGSQGRQVVPFAALHPG